jgi:membrane-associated HD superfamily phosphohydrolase
MYQESNIAVFHNIFIFIILPATIFWMFFIYEQRKTKSLGQRVSLLLCVSFIGHMFLDCIQGGTLAFFFPVSSGFSTISNIGITTDSAVFSITSDQMILILWGVIIFGANILETLIYNDIEENEYLHQSSSDNRAGLSVTKSKHPALLLAGLYFTLAHLFSQLKGKRIKKENSKTS